MHTTQYFDDTRAKQLQINGERERNEELGAALCWIAKETPRDNASATAYLPTDLPTYTVDRLGSRFPRDDGMELILSCAGQSGLIPSVTPVAFGSYSFCKVFRSLHRARLGDGVQTGSSKSGSSVFCSPQVSCCRLIRVRLIRFVALRSASKVAKKLRWFSCSVDTNRCGRVSWSERGL